jgi:hypothetical protein
MRNIEVGCWGILDEEIGVNYQEGVPTCTTIANPLRAFVLGWICGAVVVGGLVLLLVR